MAQTTYVGEITAIYGGANVVEVFVPGYRTTVGTTIPFLRTGIPITLQVREQRLLLAAVPAPAGSSGSRSGERTLRFVGVPNPTHRTQFSTKSVAEKIGLNSPQGAATKVAAGSRHPAAGRRLGQTRRKAQGLRGGSEERRPLPANSTKRTASRAPAENPSRYP